MLCSCVSVNCIDIHVHVRERERRAFSPEVTEGVVLHYYCDFSTKPLGRAAGDEKGGGEKETKKRTVGDKRIKNRKGERRASSW